MSSVFDRTTIIDILTLTYQHISMYSHFYLSASAEARFFSTALYSSPAMPPTEYMR